MKKMANRKRKEGRRKNRYKEKKDEAKIKAV